MKTQCPYCKTIFDVPPEYKDKKVKCRRCDKDFKPVKFKKPPIVIPNLPSRGNFLTKLWTKSPTAFKAGFLTTLGVVSALVLSFYVYRHLFLLDRTPTVENVKAGLLKYDLFPIYPVGQAGILRGRPLWEYKFVPDATQSLPFLSVWMDEHNRVVGVSVTWRGESTGSPADVKNDKTEQFRTKAVCKGFESLTEFDLTELSDKNFVKDESITDFDEVYFKKHNQWFIQISREKSIAEGSENYKKACRALGINAQIYRFIATAQNW